MRRIHCKDIISGRITDDNVKVSIGIYIVDEREEKIVRSAGSHAHPVTM